MSLAVRWPGRLRQIRSFFRVRSPDQMLATAAPWTSPWLPPGYEQNFWNAALRWGSGWVRCRSCVRLGWSSGRCRRGASRCASCSARWRWPTRRSAHLRRLDASAQVRISSAPLPHETIILDRRVAILAGQPSPLGREYTVTTSPALVGGVYSLFTAAWEAATDLGAYLRGEVPDLAPEAREILRALGAGLTDEAATRRSRRPPGSTARTYSASLLSSAFAAFRISRTP
jgi:hypothetical protein